MSARHLRTLFLTAVATLVTIAGTTSAGQQGAQPTDAKFGRAGRGKIVVADRASGTISLISTQTDQLIGTYELPAGDHQAEPLYVYAPPFGGRFFVGDRANNRVVAFDSRTFEVIGTRTNTVVGDPVDSPYSVPHNIAATPDGRKLYVTHSGPNNTVSVYRAGRLTPAPEYRDEITVGDNPFGLAFVR